MKVRRSDWRLQPEVLPDDCSGTSIISGVSWPSESVAGPLLQVSRLLPDLGLRLFILARFRPVKGHYHKLNKDKVLVDIYIYKYSCSLACRILPPHPQHCCSSANKHILSHSRLRVGSSKVIIDRPHTSQSSYPISIFPWSSDMVYSYEPPSSPQFGFFPVGPTSPHAFSGFYRSYGPVCTAVTNLFKSSSTRSDPYRNINKHVENESRVHKSGSGRDGVAMEKED